MRTTLCYWQKIFLTKYPLKCFSDVWNALLWFTNNGIVVNAQKTRLLCFRSSLKTTVINMPPYLYKTYCVSCECTPIQYVGCVKYLEYLSMVTYLGNITYPLFVQNCVQSLCCLIWLGSRPTWRLGSPPSFPRPTSWPTPVRANSPTAPGKSHSRAQGSTRTLSIRSIRLQSTISSAGGSIARTAPSSPGLSSALRMLQTGSYPSLARVRRYADSFVRGVALRRSLQHFRTHALGMSLVTKPRSSPLGKRVGGGAQELQPRRSATGSLTEYIYSLWPRRAP